MKVPNDIDFQTVFEGMSEPAAICDEDGAVQHLNRAARALLEPVGDPMVLNLTARETLRQMRLTPGSDHEFFMADVPVTGARRATASVSLFPLENGGFRVSFVPDPNPTLPANIRILQGMVNAHRNAELFQSEDKVAALFASCFAEVFPAYAFEVSFERESGRFAFAHCPWDPGSRPSPRDGTDCLWPLSRVTWRFATPDPRTRGEIVVEKRSEGRFSVSERAAFETFLQQFSFGLLRLWQQEDFATVSPILDQLDAVVIVCDARRRIRVANRTFEDLVLDGNVVGRDILDFFGETSRAKLRTAAASVLAGGLPQTFDAALVNADGESSSQVILDIQVVPNRQTSGAIQGFVVLGQHNEISLVELEERLSQAEHLINIGQLATGVAHELKNPLTSILNYAEYLLRKYDDQVFDARDRDRLKRIVQGVEHIDAFVRDLMTLARPEALRDEDVSLEMTLRESLLLCEPVLTARQTRVELAGEVRTEVRGSANQLKQVFVNLVTNAANAMPPGRDGLVRIEAQLSAADIVITVTDNAAGMSPDVVNRVFEPFFTTRDGAGGTGLGLSIVDSVIRRHRGSIRVDSTVGHGTTFTIVLPRGR